MSRLNAIEEFDNGISSIIDINAPKEDKVIIVDADSILHLVLYSGKNEFGEKNPEYTENDIEELKFKLDELVMKYLNQVEKYFNPISVYMCVKGDNNFRYEIYPDYKKNRPKSNPLIKILYKYFEERWNTLSSEGAEADDYVYTISKQINHSGIILSPDKDMKQIPSIIFDYKKGLWFKISEKEALYNFYYLLICGDSGDNIPGAYRCGDKYFKSNFNIDMTIEEYEKASLTAYLKASKGEEEEAKRLLELNRQLVGLKEIK